MFMMKESACCDRKFEEREYIIDYYPIKCIKFDNFRNRNIIKYYLYDLDLFNESFLPSNLELIVFQSVEYGIVFPLGLE